MRARATLFATLAVLAATGCEDLGLPDRNLPIEEAAHRPPDALVQAVHPETRSAEATPAPHGADQATSSAVQIGEQTFMPAGTPAAIDPALITQVGAGGGMTFHALRGDEAPYDRVYMTHPGGQYITYLPVTDVSGDPAAHMATQHETLTGGAPAAH